MTNKEAEKLRHLIDGACDEISFLKDTINNFAILKAIGVESSEDTKSINDQCQAIMTLLEVIVDMTSTGETS